MVGMKFVEYTDSIDLTELKDTEELKSEIDDYMERLKGEFVSSISGDFIVKDTDGKPLLIMVEVSNLKGVKYRVENNKQIADHNIKEIKKFEG